jgi:hypothetical protein
MFVDKYKKVINATTCLQPKLEKTSIVRGN